MDSNKFLLNSDMAATLYEKVKSLPIYDYHCHLSPKEIFEDKPFEDIGEMWLSGDHYKWRLMRSFGLDESLISGNAPYEDKFMAFGKALGTAAGNPLYHWSHLELLTYFNINKPLNETTSHEIFKSANKVIKEKALSPRKLIDLSNVKYIATTDDIIDSLEYHEKLENDDSFKPTVAPSFRTDNLLLIKRQDYAEYIKKLSDITRIEIDSLEALEKAVLNRLEFFKAHSCKFSDVGIAFFPTEIAKYENANDTFKKALSGNEIGQDEFNSFLGYMYVFLGKLYSENNIVMQWHLCVQRNVNSALFNECGADSGGDCIGDPIKGSDIVKILDELSKINHLPKTIIYTLNSSMTEQLCSVAGSFKGVFVGAAWWFNDYKNGIIKVLNDVSAIGHIGSFLGMLTDSRSFLSYARHDYFRRILCSLVAEWILNDEYYDDPEILIKNICCDNIKALLKE